MHWVSTSFSNLLWCTSKTSDNIRSIPVVMYMWAVRVYGIATISVLRSFCLQRVWYAEICDQNIIYIIYTHHRTHGARLSLRESNHEMNK